MLVPTAFDVMPSLGLDSPEGRVVSAALQCVGRWGISKTTLDDVAREAGCSRATVYRLFPGGKSSLIEAVGIHEVVRLFGVLGVELGRADTLEDLLVEAIVVAARFIEAHDALGYLMRHEPETLAPFLAFDRLEPLLATAVEFVAPQVERFVDRCTAEEIVEWAARLVVSYSFTPSEQIDLTHEVDVRRVLSTYLLAGIDPTAFVVTIPEPLAADPSPTDGTTTPH